MQVSDITTFWFWIGFGGLSLGSLIIYLLGTKFRPQDKLHVIIPLAVTSIATISYYALARGQADVMVGGDIVYYGRYLDWLVTTPLLLLSLIVIALPPLKKASSSRQRLTLISAVLLSDILMILTGLFADLSTEMFDVTVWYVASCLWFIIVGILMFGEVRKQAYANSAKIGETYTKLLTFLSVVWVFYPLVWVFGTTGTNSISAETEAAAYAIMDITAKAVFGILTLLALKKLENTTDSSAIADQ